MYILFATSQILSASCRALFWITATVSRSNDLQAGMEKTHRCIVVEELHHHRKKTGKMNIDWNPISTSKPICPRCYSYIFWISSSTSKESTVMDCPWNFGDSKQLPFSTEISWNILTPTPFSAFPFILLSHVLTNRLRTPKSADRSLWARLPQPLLAAVICLLPNIASSHEWSNHG